MGMMQQMFAGFPTTAGTPSVTTDALFKYVTSLLNGEQTPNTVATTTNNTFVDSSLNGITLTRLGTATQGTFSPFSNAGWSGSFNGSSDYLSVPINAAFAFGTGDFTVEAWVYQTTSAAMAILGTGDGASTNPYFYVNGLIPSIYYNTVAVATGPSIVLNTWTHVAFVRSSNDFMVYTNGVAGSGSNHTDSLTNGTAPRIGSSTVGTQFFSGSISNLRITKGTAVYTSSFTPSTIPLTAIAGTSLLTLQDNRFKDNSTNNFAITVAGTPKVRPTSPFPVTAAYSSAVNGGSVCTVSSTTDALNAAAQNGVVDISTGPFTIEAWVYCTALGTSQVICAKRTAGSAEWQLSLTTAGNISFSGMTSGGANATGVIPTNQWAHIAVVGNGTTFAIYLNGNITNITASAYTITKNNAQLINISYGTLQFKGYISDVRITGSQLYTANFVPPTAPALPITGTKLLVSGTNAGIIDSTGKNALISGTTAGMSAISPKFGVSSLYFSATTSALTVNETVDNFNFGSGDFTIESWIYPTALVAATYYTIYDSRISGSTGNVPYLNIYNATPIFGSPSGGTLLTGTTLSVNQWYHIAVVKSGGTRRMYIDGVQVASAADTLTYAAESTVTIGNSAGGSFFTGRMTEVRVTKGIGRYTTAFTPPTTQFADTTAGDPYFNYTSLLLHGAPQQSTYYMSNNNTFLDASAYGYALTRAGTPTAGTFSPFSNNGWSGYFNGTGDYITQAGSTVYDIGGTDFTIEAWINTTATAVATPIVFRSSVNGYSFCFNSVIDDGLLVVRGAASAVLFTASTGRVNDGKWHHVAWTKSGTTHTLWMDGSDVGTTVSSAPAAQTSVLYIGFDALNTIRFSGNMSNLRIVKGTAVYTTNFTPPTSPLSNITNTGLLTLQSSRIKDNSTNTLALTIVGTTATQNKSPFPVTAAYSYATNGGSMYSIATTDVLAIPAANAGDFDLSGSQWTMETWVYPTLVGVQIIYTRRSASTQWQLLLSTGNAPGIWITGNANFTASAHFAPINQWTHIAVAATGTNLTMFVNGAIAINNIAYTMAPMAATPVNVSFSGVNSFKGYISDLRLVKGAQLYTAAFTPPTAPLTATNQTIFLLNTNSAGVQDVATKTDWITVGNATRQAQITKFNTSALSFPTTTDYLSSAVMQPLGQGDWTVECWVYFTVLGKGVFHINTATVLPATVTGVAVSSSATLGWGLYWNSQQNTTGAVPSLNTWYHVAVVKSSGTTSLYIDGVLNQSGADTTNYTNTAGVIGGFHNATYVGGCIIDDFRITTGVARYTANFTPPTDDFPTQ